MTNLQIYTLQCSPFYHFGQGDISYLLCLAEPFLDIPLSHAQVVPVVTQEKIFYINLNF